MIRDHIPDNRLQLSINGIDITTAILRLENVILRRGILILDVELNQGELPPGWGNSSAHVSGWLMWGAEHIEMKDMKLEQISESRKMNDIAKTIAIISSKDRDSIKVSPVASRYVADSTHPPQTERSTYSINQERP